MGLATRAIAHTGLTLFRVPGRFRGDEASARSHTPLRKRVPPQCTIAVKVGCYLGGMRHRMHVVALLAALFLAGQLVAVPTAGILFVLTLLGRTNWPRWFVLLNPGLTYVVLARAAWLPPPLGFPVVGGAFNLSMAIFFAASLVATRNQRQLNSD